MSNESPTIKDSTRDLQGERIRERKTTSDSPNPTPDVSKGNTNPSISRDEVLTSRNPTSKSGTSPYFTDVYRRIEEGLNKYEPRPLTIEVLPVTKRITHVLLTDFIKSFDKKETEHAPTVTPFSLTAYCLIIQAYYLWLQDLTRGDDASMYAKSAYDARTFDSVKSKVEKLLVPSGLSAMLNELQPTRLPINKDISFLATLGCYLFEYDAGLLVPPSALISLHNSLVSQEVSETTTNPYNAVIIHVTQPDRYLYVGNFAAVMNRSRSEAVPNDLFTKFNLVKSTITRKGLAGSKFVFEQIPQSPYVIQNNTSTPTFNPYLFYTNTYVNQRRSTLDFLMSMSDYLSHHSSVYSNLGTLGSVAYDASSETLLKYMVIPYDAPTSYNISSDGTTPVDHTTTTQSSVTLMDAIYTSTDQDEVSIHRDTLDANMIHVSTSEAIPLVPAMATQYQHETSHIQLFISPLSIPKTAFVNTSLAGKIVMNGNLAGFILPAPTPAATLRANNDVYKSSFLPMSNIVPRFATDAKFTYIPYDGPSEPVFFQSLPDIYLFSPDRNIPKTLIDTIKSATTKLYCKYNFFTPKAKNRKVKPTTHFWSSYRVNYSDSTTTKNTVHVLTNLYALHGYDVTSYFAEYNPGSV